MYNKKRQFTILELIVSMSVLLVMMTIMMRFFSDAQKAWFASSGQAEIYDNGRIAMDLITSDLNAISFSTRPVNCRHTAESLGFFSYLKGDLKKVRYQVCTAANNKNYFLTRSVYTDENDFAVGATKNTVFPLPPSDDSTFKRIIPNVVSIKFTCYDDKLIETTTDDQFPWYIKIDLGLLGSKNFAKWEALKKVGKEEKIEPYIVPISKLIYLGYRGQP